MLFLDGYVFFAVEDIKTCDTIIEEHFTERSLDQLCDAIETTGAACEKRLIELSENKNSFSTAEYIEELCDAYAEMVGVWVIATFLSQALEKLVREKSLAVSDAEMLHHLAAYARPTWLEQQNIEIKAFTKELLEKSPELVASDVSEQFLERYPDMQAKLTKHVVEFEWFGTHHWVGDSYTIEKACADIRDVVEKGSIESETLSEATGDPSQKALWQLMASFMYWRTHAAEVTAKVVYHSRDILTALAQGWDMTYDQVVYLSSEEAVSAAKQNLSAIERPTNFAERATAYGCHIDDHNQEVVVTGAILEQLTAQVVDTVATDITELHGVTASAGPIVRGYAKVILSPQDVSKFLEGDILVASETTPNFVPLMKKALAIVTETGGITSHAAIISRELRKPCVIGTKIATQAIKDGDLLEIDTGSGTITILQKANN